MTGGRRGSGVAWAMLAPFLAGFAIFGVWPIVRTLWVGLVDRGGPTLRHHAFAATDPLAWLAAANTVGFALAFAAITVPAAFALALLIRAAPPRLRVVAAVTIFATHLIGSAFAGLLFRPILLDRRLGLEAMLTTPGLAMVTLLLVATYVGVGFGVVLLLAALRRVDPHLLDAARLDGAGVWRQTWSVLVPQVRPTLALLAVAGVWWGLQVFELPYALFGGPGPGYRVLSVTMLLLDAGLRRGDEAYAAAVATQFAVVVLVLTLGLAWLLRVGREEVGVE
jgi:ABC-type sugar transport system permease subunit